MPSAKFEVLLDKRAEKEFLTLPLAVQQRFASVFERMENDPFRSRPGCDVRILKGRAGLRAIRVGEYRGIYEIVERQVRFTIFGHRKSVYDS